MNENEAVFESEVINKIICWKFEGGGELKLSQVLNIG